MPLKKIDYLPFLDACWQESIAPKPADAPTVISTFAGCGGSSLGYSMAGFRELLAIEWDDNAVETFKLNFPDVPVYHGDIAKISVEQVLEMTGLQPGELDIFDGSPPCQGFSTAGKRQLDDPRNQLFREYVRLLRGLRPKVFVMENVSGMVKGVMKIVFVEILKELKASGYKVSARLLNAMYFNVPQSRQRMIFIGVRDDLAIDPSHPEAESVPVTVKEACPEVDEYVFGKGILQPVQIVKSNTVSFQTFGKSQSAGNGRCGDVFISGIRQKMEVRHVKRGASFPDLFRFSGNLKNVWERAGNSVPPLFMRSIARHIRREILET